MFLSAKIREKGGILRGFAEDLHYLFYNFHAHRFRKFCARTTVGFSEKKLQKKKTLNGNNFTFIHASKATDLFTLRRVHHCLHK